MLAHHLSQSIEMYLKAMVEMDDREAVSIGRLAERLSVTAVSANEMVRRLDEQGLVSHVPYKGVTLTEKGREAAWDVVRRQRLWECFLYEYLKIEWARVYELACSLEHATAPEVTEALAVFLGEPKTCPRGNPIPAADGTYMPLDGIPLTAIQIGETVRVLAVTATSTEVLLYLQERGLLPGCEVTVVGAEPLGGPLMLRIDGKEISLGLSLAEFLIVKKVSEKTNG